MRTHGTDLRPENLAMLADFLAAQSSFGGRLRYALTGAARRQTPGGDLILRGLQIAGRV
jgi:hypothetical protein